MHASLRNALARVKPSPRAPVVFLTGAGFSVASGIPTFRGEEGYWTVGSQVYHPQDLATKQAYHQMPREVWQWYLYRKAICNEAAPNAAHRALVELEAQLADSFCLITQNVDGLHRRAGSTDARMCEVHGDIDLMRDEGTGMRLPIPAELAHADKTRQLTDAEWTRLHGATRFRPHILWFDEYYEERFHRSETAMHRASECCLFVVVGTSGAASLPLHATAAAAENGAVIVDINPSDNPFRAFARQYERGYVMETDALTGVEAVCEALLSEA